MTVDKVENKTINEISNGWQTFLFRFVAVVALLLIAIPTLPTLISNLVYSFSGASPKIYWYLSRASGFVTLTILWISMALGLGITNKMTRLWPGAPTAFAMHQFTSLLGLAFSAYHALVLMGDHFVDFSLPRLLQPFSIAYETFWVGLGQLCFYLWVVTVVSFYFRQHIGQKVWRLMHYVNFAVYVMGFLHGLNSGTDSHDVSALWYFGLSGLSITILLAYRLGDVLVQKKVSLPKLAFPQIPPIRAKLRTVMQTILSFRLNVPKGFPWEQVKKLIPKRKKNNEAIPGQIEALPTLKIIMKKDSTQEASRENSTVTKLEGTIQGNSIRVYIFKEPTDHVVPELQNEAGLKQPGTDILFQKMRETLRITPAEPFASESRSNKIPILEE